MNREVSLLTLATLAVAVLAYYVVAVSGGFLSGTAIGILFVYVVIQWSHLRRRS